MTQSHFVNPNGLPADEQVTSARDMAILARAAIKEFPEYDYYWHLPGIRFGKKVLRNYNTLIGRYPGADGMKTGFICASGFNLVATATRDGKRLIAVVLGAPSSAGRAIKAAQLLERGFASDGLGWLTPSTRDGRGARSGQRRAAQSARGHVRQAPQETGERGRGRFSRHREPAVVIRFGLFGVPVGAARAWQQAGSAAAGGSPG